MPRISSRDVQRLSVVIQDLYGATDLDTFATCVVRGLRQIVPGDRASYHHASPEPHRVTTIAGDGGSSLPAGDAIMAQMLREHYLVRSLARQHSRRWLRVSDVLTRDAFRRSGLYEHYYRPMGIEFQIGVVFRGAQDGFLGMVVNRETKDFSERDRSLLDLLLPHLVLGQANAARLTRLQREGDAFRQGADLAHVGVVVLDPERHIRLMTHRAVRWVQTYFGLTLAPRRLLPRALDDWVAHELRDEERLAPRRPFVVECQNRRLQVRLASNGHGLTLILTETLTELPLDSLEALGLSRREAEVLKWVAEGKRNAEIACVLGIAQATVQHHLERVHRKLGVETRTAAAARARDAAQQGLLGESASSTSIARSRWNSARSPSI